jgi:hypothetical protein
MTTVTITINLSDLVDVVNNSKNPEVCKHLLSGGPLNDLNKMLTEEGKFYTHRIIWEKKDGKKTDNFIILQATGYDIWRDEVSIKVLQHHDKIYCHNSYSWSAWCAMEEVQGDEYALMALESEPSTECDLYDPNLH